MESALVFRILVPRWRSIHLISAVALSINFLDVPRLYDVRPVLALTTLTGEMGGTGPDVQDAPLIIS